MQFQLYVADTETTGLDQMFHSPVEISLIRLSDGEQKTWHLQPLDLENISSDALRVNGLKIEDLKGFTKEGRELYQDPNKVLIEIENWLTPDGALSSERLLVGQNIGFDKGMLIQLWSRCNAIGTFPFSQKYSLDTMMTELMINYCLGTLDEPSAYSLKALAKKWGVINAKAHSAAADTLATKEVFLRQAAFLRQKFIC